MTDHSRPSEPVPSEEPPAEPEARELEPPSAPIRWLCSRTGMRHVSG
jgi:hypothetical protein